MHPISRSGSWNRSPRICYPWQLSLLNRHGYVHFNLTFAALCRYFVQTTASPPRRRGARGISRRSRPPLVDEEPGPVSSTAPAPLVDDARAPSSSAWTPQRPRLPSPTLVSPPRRPPPR